MLKLTTACIYGHVQLEYASILSTWMLRLHSLPTSKHNSAQPAHCCKSQRQATVIASAHQASASRLKSQQQLGVVRQASRRNEKNEKILTRLLSMDDAALREQTATVAETVSIDFMTWLLQREQDARGEEKAAINKLGGKLTALREGIDPVAADELASHIRGANRSNDTAQSIMSEPGRGALATQVEQRRTELARRMALDAVSPAQLAKDQTKAKEFAEALRENRAASVASMIGRAPVEMGQARKGLDAASAAERILDTLLSVEDREERLAMVSEAFVPPSAASNEDRTPDQDLVYTSPMRLLQAVTLALSRLRADTPGRDDGFLVPMTGHVGAEGRRADLLDIKKAIFDKLDQNSNF